MAKGTSRRRKRSTSRKGSRGGMAPWYLAAIVIVGGIVAYDHREKLGDLSAGREIAALLAEPARKPKVAATPARPKEQTGSIVRKPALAVPSPVERPMEQVPEPAAPRPVDNGTFYFCGIRHDNCVIDGDTFLFNGERILIADIDAPETRLAKCDEERSRGSHAKARLRELLNAGKFTLVASERKIGADEAGKPRLVVRDGKSLGETLISEGLVRRRAGSRLSWCGQSGGRASG
ncbi:endonuclease YncB(thermonuclease family) [Ensifer sp. WSM1721]|uniref:thermonuclease family protein n=1 Tax=Ensifer sp. WSM1721 TaxID=1041159 RepID=UPI000478AEEF|nr:thermonuclease family protein [Ensifer sp. WSM1721]